MKRLSRGAVMTSTERRVVSALAAVLAMRMLGLFMVLPVMMLYASDLSGRHSGDGLVAGTSLVASTTLAGLALGIYGLTQALFQIPFGIWSDRVGRKKVIHAGLLCFILGSVVVATAEHVYIVIAGRALQGAGAIASVVLALAADLTREVQRAKAMAVLGIGIGGMFMLSLVVGPLLKGWLGVAGMFWLAAGLGGVAMALLQWCVPEVSHQATSTASRRPAATRAHVPPLADAPAPNSPQRTALLAVVCDARLLRLNFGALSLHFALAAMFVALPGALVQIMALPAAQHWQVYAPVLLTSIPVMAALLAWLTRTHGKDGWGGARGVWSVALCLGVLAFVVLYAATDGVLLVAGLWLFFCGFNTLEAALPAAVSQCVPSSSRGATLSVYYSAQFLGVFCGGTGGGYLLGRLGSDAVYLACAALLLLCLASLGTRTLRRAEGGPA